MSDEYLDYPRFIALIFIFLILASGIVGESSETDKHVLLELKLFLETQNQVNRGRYTEWNARDLSPCNWPGISCNGTRVTGINLSESSMAGTLFGNFSGLSELSYLDLSRNSISGEIPVDLGRCEKLKLLNLSHNMINSEINFTGLYSLEILDLSINRIHGEIWNIFPRICQNLVILNVSSNNLTGEIGNFLDVCSNIQYVDLSVNRLSGYLGFGFERLKEFLASENRLGGIVSVSENCTLQTLDLSENDFRGEFPRGVSNCQNLTSLNMWGNKFTGPIPQEIGLLSNLQGLMLGNNSFDRGIPESLLNLSNLEFLDLSRNKFGGDIQEIFGRFIQVKNLLLHGNSFTGGIISSGILNLPNISRIDLSYNNFTGPLPVEVSQMSCLKFLFLAHNHFTGNIPPEYGNFPRLQALDLSFNKLNGSIPSSFGKLTSLLWLMLANNSLTGTIPPALGNCSSLLWLNLANNQLSGNIPPELADIGKNPTPTFEFNRKKDITAGSGECFAMRRWIPADYPPFSFVYTVLTRKSCRSLWDRLLKGYGVFPVCVPGSTMRTFQISGYVQLSGNRFSGEVPHEIGKMLNFSMLNLGFNQFSGPMPKEIGRMPLIVLNISHNGFSGEIPADFGHIKCMQSLDMSYNNFSGTFPTSFNNLTDLNMFNISYNPYISGLIPATGQFATFEKWSYLGDPLLLLPSFIRNNTSNMPGNEVRPKRPAKLGVILLFVAILLALVVCGVMTLIICVMRKTLANTPSYLLEDVKERNDFMSSSSASSPWLSDVVKVIRLDKTSFTHADILMATGNFSEGRIIGRGGSGTVYRGVLPDGREIAVKKLQREGVEGEKEFRAEMEVLSGNGFGWPHPNLVVLYGWCLDGSEKLLVYEYMGGGSLEEFISDRTRMTWRRRVDVAVDVARALVFLHHECFPAIVHRDVKASNVLLDKDGRARVTDFGLARVVDAGSSHISTMVAGTIGYVAPEYGQTWQATTKGDVYSYGVLAMELATGRRAVDGGEECLVEWARRVVGDGRQGFNRSIMPVALLVSGLVEEVEEMRELLQIGIRCTAEAPQHRPNMKEVLAMLFRISIGNQKDFSFDSSPPSL